MTVVNRDARSETKPRRVRCAPYAGAGLPPSAPSPHPVSHLPRFYPFSRAEDLDDCAIHDNRLPLNEQTAFGVMAKRIRYSKGDCLFRPNHSDQFLHLLLEGVVCEHRSLADGRRLISSFALPGDFIGFCGGEGATADALDSVATLRMSRSDYSRFQDANPALRLCIQPRLDRELALGRERMMLLARYTAREKVAAFLVHMLDRWRLVNGRTAYLPLPMTRQDIGDFLAIRLETASRTITAFAREGLLIVVPEGVRILDIPRIRAMALA